MLPLSQDAEGEAEGLWVYEGRGAGTEGDGAGTEGEGPGTEGEGCTYTLEVGLQSSVVIQLVDVRVSGCPFRFSSPLVMREPTCKSSSTARRVTL